MPVLDLRGRGFLPRLLLPWLHAPADEYVQRAKGLYARQLAIYGRRLFNVGPAGDVSLVDPGPITTVLCTLADLLAHLAAGTPGCSLCNLTLPLIVPLQDGLGRRAACPSCGGYIEQKRIGVYESGGPTGAKPGRQWITRQPLPWESSGYVRFRQWERPLYLCEVSPVKWSMESGYLTYMWPLRIEGEEAIFDGLAQLWRGRRPLCARCKAHGLRGCRHVWRRGLLPPHRPASAAEPGPDGCYCFTGCAPCSFCCPRQEEAA